MRIYTRSGDLAFKTFTFPDGQPHFKLETEADAGDFMEATIEAPIRNFNELGEILLATSVLQHLGYTVSLDIRYLLGARMDRAIDAYQPFTLQTIARLINGAGFTRVRVLDAHSEVATRLIRNCTNLLPKQAFESVVARDQHCTIVIPDKGAVNRVLDLSRGPSGYVRNVLYCTKKRDPQTGQLSGVKVESTPQVGEGLHYIIADDICDGGGTFVLLAKELRERIKRHEGHAEGQWQHVRVDLFVTHGIFSKGGDLEGIDHTYTTDSYCNWAQGKEWGHPKVTVIPVSMRDMK